MKVAFRSDATGKYVSLTAFGGVSDTIGPGETFEVVFVDGTLPVPLPPPPPPLSGPSEAGWWGPDRASLFTWVWDHYLNHETRSVANVNYWVGEILKHPGDDPLPADNEGYWIRQMAK